MGITKENQRYDQRDDCRRSSLSQTEQLDDEAAIEFIQDDHHNSVDDLYHLDEQDESIEDGMQQRQQQQQQQQQAQMQQQQAQPQLDSQHNDNRQIDVNELAATDHGQRRATTTNTSIVGVGGGPHQFVSGVAPNIGGGSLVVEAHLIAAAPLPPVAEEPQFFSLTDAEDDTLSDMIDGYPDNHDGPRRHHRHNSSDVMTNNNANAPLPLDNNNNNNNNNVAPTPLQTAEINGENSARQAPFLNGTNGDLPVAAAADITSNLNRNIALLSSQQQQSSILVSLDFASATINANLGGGFETTRGHQGSAAMVLQPAQQTTISGRQSTSGALSNTIRGASLRERGPPLLCNNNNNNNNNNDDESHSLTSGVASYRETDAQFNSIETAIDNSTVDRVDRVDRVDGQRGSTDNTQPIKRPNWLEQQQQRQAPGLIGGSVRLRGENIKQIYRDGSGTLKSRQQRDKEASAQFAAAAQSTNNNVELIAEEQQQQQQQHVQQQQSKLDRVGRLPSFKRNQSVSFRVNPLRRNRHSVDIRNLPSYLSNKRRTSIVDVAFNKMSSLFAGGNNNSSNSNFNNQQQDNNLDELSSDEPIFEEPIAPTLSLGQRVALVKANGSDFGTVGWIGRIPQIEDEWAVGVIFDNAIGNSDGEINGIRYFHARNNFAMFLPLSALTKTENYIGRPETGTVLSRMSVSLRPGQMISIQRSTVRLQHCFLNAPHQRVGHDVRAVSNRLHCQCHNCGPCAHLTKQGRFTALTAHVSGSMRHHDESSSIYSSHHHQQQHHHHHHHSSSSSSVHQHICNEASTYYANTALACCQQSDTTTYKPSVWPSAPPAMSTLAPTNIDEQQQRRRSSERSSKKHRSQRHHNNNNNNNNPIVSPPPPPLLDMATLNSIIDGNLMRPNEAAAAIAVVNSAKRTLDSTSSHDFDDTRYYADLETARLERRRQNRRHVKQKNHRSQFSEASSANVNELFGGIKQGALTESSASSMSSSCSSSSLTSHSNASSASSGSSSSASSYLAAKEAPRELPYHDRASLQQQSLDIINDPFNASQNNVAVSHFSNNIPNPSMSNNDLRHTNITTVHAAHYRSSTTSRAILLNDEHQNGDNHRGLAKRLRSCMSCFLPSSRNSITGSNQSGINKLKKRKAPKNNRMMEYRRKQSTFVPSTLARPREDFASHGIATPGSIQELNNLQYSSYTESGSSSSSSLSSIDAGLPDNYRNINDAIVDQQAAVDQPLYDNDIQTLQLEHRQDGPPSTTKHSNYTMNILHSLELNHNLNMAAAGYDINDDDDKDYNNLQTLDSTLHDATLETEIKLPNDDSKDSALADIGDLPNLNNSEISPITDIYKPADIYDVNNHHNDGEDGLLAAKDDHCKPDQTSGQNNSHSLASNHSSTVTISTVTTTDGAQNSVNVSSVTANSPQDQDHQLSSQLRRLDLDRDLDNNSMNIAKDDHFDESANQIE